MLCTLTLLAALVAVVSGAGSSAPLCCMPDQFRVTNFYTNTNIQREGTSHHTVKSVSAYDYTNHREVYLTTRTGSDGTETKFDYYLLYPENRMFVLDHQTGVCIKARLNKNHGRRCVPGFSRVTDAAFTYGAGADNFTAYRAMFHAPRLDGNHLYTSMTVGPNCIPVVVKLTLFPWGAGGMESETIEYNDVEIGPTPDNLFHLPLECCEAEFGVPTVFPGLHFDFQFE